MKVVVDIWGGEDSQIFYARYIRPIENALEVAKEELERGYLVNLRTELAWGDFEEFDGRKMRLQ